MMNLAAAALIAASTLSSPGNALPSQEQIMAVPPELEAQLQERVIRKSESKEERLRLLIALMLGDGGLSLEYDNDTTRTVAETFRTHKANCLSFTLLFVALAREAGLKVNIQEYEQVLLWYLQDELVYNSSHVNVRVEAGSLRQVVDVGRNVLLTRFRPVNISIERALSFFYDNRGVELMAAGDLASARRHFEESIALAPDEAPAWSNLGVLNMRVNDLVAAEHAYLTALKLDARSGAALANIVTLYKRTGQQDLAASYLRRLQAIELADPFHQFMLAMDYEKRGDYANAVVHYRRAIRLHDREPAFHIALARTYQEMGDTRRAQRSQTRALALADENARRALHARQEERRQRAGSVGRNTVGW